MRYFSEEVNEMWPALKRTVVEDIKDLPETDEAYEVLSQIIDILEQSDLSIYGTRETNLEEINPTLLLKMN